MDGRIEERTATWRMNVKNSEGLLEVAMLVFCSIEGSVLVVRLKQRLELFYRAWKGPGEDIIK